MNRYLLWHGDGNKGAYRRGHCQKCEWRMWLILSISKKPDLENTGILLEQPLIWLQPATLIQMRVSESVQKSPARFYSPVHLVNLVPTTPNSTNGNIPMSISSHVDVLSANGNHKCAMVRSNWKWKFFFYPWPDVSRRLRWFLKTRRTIHNWAFSIWIKHLNFERFGDLFQHLDWGC